MTFLSSDIAPEGFKSSQKPSYHEEEFLEMGEVEDDESSEQFTGNKGQILLVCAWVSVKVWTYHNAHTHTHYAYTHVGGQHAGRYSAEPRRFTRGERS